MVSRDDRRAAGLVLGLAVVGALVRWVAGGEAPGAVAYRPAGGVRPVRESVAVRADRLARPLARGERIDVNRADARELTRLPRIGPALAARIVDERTRRGGFRSAEDLARVSGIGPRLVETLGPHVVFGSMPSGGRGRAGPRPASTPRVSLNRASAAELETLPGIGPARAQAIVTYRTEHGAFRTVDDLVQVKGIGPGTVERLRALVTVP